MNTRRQKSRCRRAFE